MILNNIDKLIKTKLLFHLSEVNVDNTILTPRIPNNWLIQNGFEDGTIPRVSFSLNINGALRALSKNLNNKILYVHTPIIMAQYIIPTIQQVPDRDLTNEVWVLSPVKIKYIYKILVKNSLTAPLKYTVNNGNEYSLYDWAWEKI
jgi:hypothetical protein